jgi:tyrosyl-tRNA synthetase
VLTPQQEVDELGRGIVDFVSRDDLQARLQAARAAGRPLRVKVGFDPTRPDLHLGHAVLMQKMRQFQELGHEVVFIVGDFTAAIGDPTGRNRTRPPLTREQIDEGARSYAEQAYHILDRARTRLEYNSTWLSSMTFADVVRLAGKYTLARMLERQDFRQRQEQQVAISIHELLYPLAQAYDSVHLRCDVELGGTDQLFNLMVGRDLMKEYGLPPQIVMTTPLLEGTSARFEDGRIAGDKMSKSLDNYVGITEPPATMLGKLMSIIDPLIWRYRELLTDMPAAEIVRRRADCDAGRTNPRDEKMALAVEITARFHGAAAATAARADWERQFSQRGVPETMPEHVLAAALPLAAALAQCGLAASNSDARRKIGAGAVDVDGERVRDPQAQLGAGRHVVRAGRSYARIDVGG